MHLEIPDITHKQQVNSLLNDFIINNADFEGLRELHIYVHTKSYEQWLQYVLYNKEKLHTTEYFVMQDNQIIGMIEIREKYPKVLLNEFGHIGYSLSPSYRSQGLAPQMLDLALQICRENHMHSVLITCTDTNIPSYKTIERCGGNCLCKFTSRFENTLYRRYQIKLS